MDAMAPAALSPVIASPCIKVCAVDGMTGLCVGCGRTLREIGNWSRYEPAERDAIMSALPARRAALSIG